MTTTSTTRPTGHPVSTSRKEFPFMTVHEALIQARLDEQQVHVNAARGAAAREFDAAPAPARPATDGWRVRVGHRLVALGAALAGEDARSHAHHAA